jgi:hypothetical protein
LVFPPYGIRYIDNKLSDYDLIVALYHVGSQPKKQECVPDDHPFAFFVSGEPDPTKTPAEQATRILTLGEFLEIANARVTKK